MGGFTRSSAREQGQDKSAQEYCDKVQAQIETQPSLETDSGCALWVGVGVL
jgi:hypothetical protein